MSNKRYKVVIYINSLDKADFFFALMDSKHYKSNIQRVELYEKGLDPKLPNLMLPIRSQGDLWPSTLSDSPTTGTGTR